MKKTLQPTNELFIQFSDEEVQELGLEQGQRFDVELQEDGSVKLMPWGKIELDMEDWPRETLEAIIKESCERDVSANEVIIDLVKEGLKQLDEGSKLSDEEVFSDTTKSSYEDKGLKSICGCSSNDAVLPTASNSGYVTTSSSDILQSL